MIFPKLNIIDIVCHISITPSLIFERQIPQDKKKKHSKKRQQFYLIATFLNTI